MFQKDGEYNMKLKLYCWWLRVEFTIGDLEVKKFRMIERHYFHDRLLKSFDFEFGYLIPQTRNTMEHIYEFPELSKQDSKLIPFFGCGDMKWTVLYNHVIRKGCGVTFLITVAEYCLRLT